jgi:hypothetical protein
MRCAQGKSTRASLGTEIRKQLQHEQQLARLVETEIIPEQHCSVVPTYGNWHKIVNKNILKKNFNS